MIQNRKFSIFGTGYRNQRGEAVLATKPQQTQSAEWVYRYIISERARWATETLRSMVGVATREELNDFKKLNFEVATFAGIFGYRNARNLMERSPFMVLDIDDLASTEEARSIQRQLIDDEMVETELCFLSPKGRGVKWVVRIPEWAQDPNFKMTFQKLQQHAAFELGVTIDKSGSDICRACFLPHDKDCFINKKNLIYEEIK
ncbi:MAG: hypothetical protein K5764_01125 [Prevotella sp.]|nr:hypothetical protein [Prevotella sp.]